MVLQIWRQQMRSPVFGHDHPTIAGWSVTKVSIYCFLFKFLNKITT